MIRRFLRILPFKSSQHGSTLLVTLGILTVISTIAVVFLTVSRIRQRTMISKKNIQQIEDQFDRSLQTVIHDLEKALSSPNYSDEEKGAQYPKRLAPVNKWFSQHYYGTNDTSNGTKIIPELGSRILLSKTEKGREDQSVRLLTPEVLDLLPPAVTNELMEALDKKDWKEKFRSGWIYLDDPALDLTERDLRARVQYHPTRISYAIVNVSDMFDANYPLATSTSEKLAKQVFHAADLTNWIDEVKLDLDHNLETNLPFTAYSYDPDPEVLSINVKGLSPLKRLGYHTFDLPPAADLNTANTYSLLSGMDSMGPVSKFKINSITNFIPSRPENSPPLNSTAWYNDSNFKTFWWDPVVSIVNQIKTTKEDGDSLPDASKLAWSIANFMDPDRIPQISTFTAVEGTDKQALPSRINYAVEALPMISKVILFNIFDEEGHANKSAPKTPGYYGLKTGFTNHYAVALELWYPFAPLSPFRDQYNGDIKPKCYVGIYTNQTDATTTTNAPWTSNLLRDWIKLESRKKDQTLYETIFKLWADQYTKAQGPLIWTNPLWRSVNLQNDLWFTSEMQQHPYWPSPIDTNGTFNAESNFIWQAFHPNLQNTIATNTYLFLPNAADAPISNQVVVTDDLMPFIITNIYMGWSSDDTVKKMIHFDPGSEKSPFPTAIWFNSESFETNEWSGFVSGSDTNQFGKNFLFSNLIMDESNQFYIVSSQLNSNGWHEVTNQLDSLLLGTNLIPTVSIPVDDLGVITEITQPEPLPDDPHDPLLPMASAIIDTLPTNSTEELNTILMMKAGDANLDWDSIFESLSSVPNLIPTLFPSRQLPSTGNLGEDDAYELENDKDGEVEYREVEGEDKDFVGSYWVVYPKKYVNFMEIKTEIPPDGSPEDAIVITNYYRIGDTSGGKTRNVWIRPLVTIAPESHSPDKEIKNDLLAVIDNKDDKDVIVDEALLEGHEKEDTPFVHAWNTTNSIVAPDPRNNALYNQWVDYEPIGEKDWDEFWEPTNGTEIAELPFIHYDRPFNGIGEIGHIYTSPTKKPQGFKNQMPRDTVTFSTRTGAALLDFFTTSTNEPSTPVHGRIQANTDTLSVLHYLFKQGQLGWLTGRETCDDQYYDELRKKFENDSSWGVWPEVYTNALKYDEGNAGWFSYADMMPKLAGIDTNMSFDAESPWEGRDDLHPMHDYTEDAIRHLPELFSFRQSIYHIVLCVQTLSPGSTVDYPEKLAERRVFVTILRDTFTGRWMVAEWKWLD